MTYKALLEPSFNYSTPRWHYRILTNYHIPTINAKILDGLPDLATARVSAIGHVEVAIIDNPAIESDIDPIIHRLDHAVRQSGTRIFETTRHCSILISRLLERTFMQREQSCRNRLITETSEPLTGERGTEMLITQSLPEFVKGGRKALSQTISRRFKIQSISKSNSR